MPTITLTFNLPEDRCEANIAVKAMGFALSCQDFDNELRKHLKYGHKFTSADHALEEIRDTLHQIMNYNGVSLCMIE